VQHAQQPERHLVVGHEHRGDAGVVDQPAAELVAGACAPVADERGPRLGARGVHRVLPARDPLA
jgi:hypothetical protein